MLPRNTATAIFCRRYKWDRGSEAESISIPANPPWLFPLTAASRFP